MAIEQLANLFFNAILPQSIQAGDLDALRRFVEKIDDDNQTVRGAVWETIKEMMPPVPATGTQAGTSSQMDALRMIRSLTSGGIPGRAEGQPGPGLRGVLPNPVQRQLAQVAPGGTAT